MKNLIQDAAKAIDIFGEDALEEYKAKKNLVTFLINDFKRDNPKHTRAEVLELYWRLDCLEISELKLLAEGCKNAI